MIIAYAFFWIFVIALAYTYFGYPVIMVLLSHSKSRRSFSKENLSLPQVSLIIAAHNEEKVIGQKIKNSLNLDYPEDLLSIVIVSDGSTDRTNEIVNEFVSDSRFKFLYYHRRRGKAHALNLGVANSESEIIVFSDANIWYEPDSLKMLVRNFSDPSVGCVCGKVLLEKPKESKEPIGEGAYMKYERFIHQNESRFNTMIGTDGAMYAIRRELFKPLPEDAIVDDFIIAMRVLEKKYRIVYEPKAIGYEEAASSVGQEFKRKVRMISGGFQAIGVLKKVLSPLNHPTVFFQFMSHKLFRWLTPIFMLMLFFTNILLFYGVTYRVTLAGQIVFYSLALFALFLKPLRRKALFYFPYYFCSLNLAASVGLKRYFFKQQSVKWEKVSR
jgi:cellulose synthase/poly-beta-1,6-N-acetylglucosamine synthase-like glycosyltransferase